jgi:hypothetical protein
VGNQDRVAREASKPAQRRFDSRSTPQHLIGDAGETADSSQTWPGRDERFERSVKCEPPDTDCADFANPGIRDREPGRLEVEDHEGGILEAQRLLSFDRDRAVLPGKSRVALNQSFEQSQREFLGGNRHRKEMPRRVLCRGEPAAFFDERNQSVQAVRSQPHRSSLYERMFDQNWLVAQV